MSPLWFYYEQNFTDDGKRKSNSVLCYGHEYSDNHGFIKKICQGAILRNRWLQNTTFSIGTPVNMYMIEDSSNTTHSGPE